MRINFNKNELIFLITIIQATIIQELIKNRIRME